MIKYKVHTKNLDMQMLVNILMYTGHFLPHTISDELESNVIDRQTEWPISEHTNGRQNNFF